METSIGKSSSFLLTSLHKCFGTQSYHSQIQVQVAGQIYYVDMRG